MHAVDNILTSLVAKNKTPSVQYVIFNTDRIVHSFILGFSDVENQKKIKEDSTYNVFSITKTFTALAILQLAEKNKLHIDNSVKQYFTDFPYSKEITIHQLLSHSAGIPNPNPLPWIHLAEEHPGFNDLTFFNEVYNKYKNPRSRPNRKFRYSNLGYVLLGQLIETVSGQTFEDYIRDHIIKPLELWPEELDFEIFDQDKHSKGYQKKRTPLNAILGFFINKSKFMGPAEGKWKPFKPLYVHGASYGGLIGNRKAFIAYLRELLKPDSKLLSKKYKKILISENCTTSGAPTGMCLSWFTGILNDCQYFHHAGGGGGYYCEIRLYPDLQLGSIILFNRSGIKDERYLNKLDAHFINGKEKFQKK